MATAKQQKAKRGTLGPLDLRYDLPMLEAALDSLSSRTANNYQSEVFGEEIEMAVNSLKAVVRKVQKAHVAAKRRANSRVAQVDYSYNAKC